MKKLIKGLLVIAIIVILILAIVGIFTHVEKTEKYTCYGTIIKFCSGEKFDL